MARPPKIIEAKPVGRPATPVRRMFRDVLAELNVNSIQRLVAIAEHKDTHIDKKIEIYRDFLKYEYATAKTVIHEIDGEGSVSDWLAKKSKEDRPAPATVTKTKRVGKKPAPTVVNSTDDPPVSDE